MHLFNYLSFPLRRHINSRPNLQKIVSNAGWLIFEKIIRLALGLGVSILVARHLGPKQFGILSYATSLIAFMGSFIYLGLSGLVVRDVLRFPDEKEMILGTVFSLKLTGSIIAFATITCFVLFSSNAGESEFWVLLIIGLSLFAMPFETIEFWFQSQVQSKYSVLAKSAAFFFTAALKIVFVFLGTSVVTFACASSTGAMLTAIFLIYIYHKKGYSILQWNSKISKAKELLSQSWIIILSGFFAQVNLKIDQVMLRWISGTTEVGIYSVAVTFSEVWYFIPDFIAISAYPRLIELKKSNNPSYDMKLQQVLDIMFVLSVTVALAMTFLAGPLIPILYSNAYAESSAILVIHVWAGIFMFMRAVFSKWVLIENALFFSLISHGSGAIINVLLNSILIPRYGGKGSAIATLFSYAVSSYFFLFFYPKTRSLAAKMSRAFILPIRLIIHRDRIWT